MGARSMGQGGSRDPLENCKILPSVFLLGCVVYDIVCLRDRLWHETIMIDPSAILNTDWQTDAKMIGLCRYLFTFSFLCIKFNFSLHFAIAI